MNRSSFLCRLLRHTQLTASDRLLWWRLVQKEVFKLFVAKLILFLKCLFTQQGLGQQEILELDVRRVAGSRENLSVKQREKKRFYLKLGAFGVKMKQSSSISCSISNFWKEFWRFWGEFIGGNGRKAVFWGFEFYFDIFYWDYILRGPEKFLYLRSKSILVFYRLKIYEMEYQNGVIFLLK